MKMKLLSPAGEMESLKQAVYNGADEVYLGVKDFNARNIEGFNLKSLEDAVKFAHVFGVKVHLTVNILFTDDELQQALDLVVDAYNLGADAFIVQDIGLIYLLNKHYPEIEVHASTQMGLHNLEGVKQLEKLGIKRVVLSRETPIEEIKRIRQNSNIEIEYFVQGALCVSFSGNCYISSYLEDASGNRGKCRQLCRLPYSLLDGNKEITKGFLLSAKDFCMLDRLSELEQAGVNAIKIEGRARRPFYVGTATKYYRNALDGDTISDRQDLNLAFNREFTEAYFNGNGNIISRIQGHNGIDIGSVAKVNKGKKFNEVIIDSDYDLSPKSTLKIFRNENEFGVISPYDIKTEKGKIIFTTTTNLKEGDRVALLMDSKKESEMLSKKVKKEIIGKIIAKQDLPITAEFEINNNKLVIEGEVLQLAKNQPLTTEEIQQNFNKSELFEFDLNFDMDKVFMPKAQLNEFRRICIEKLTAAYTETKKLKKIKINTKNNVNLLKNYKFIENLIDFDKIKEQNIIYSPEIYTKKEIADFTDLCLKFNKIPYLNLPIFATSEDIKILDNLLQDKTLGVVANNLYALKYQNPTIIGGGLNVYNSVSANYFGKPCLLAENSELGATLKMPYMTLRHCPFKQYLKGDCTNCPYKKGLKYRMQSGKEFNLKRTKLSSCTFYLTD